MVTYGSTTLTSYNTITKIEVYYYQSNSPTSLSGGSWSTTKPTWENGKYIWQKIRTYYEGFVEGGTATTDGSGNYYTESDPINITGQQGNAGRSYFLEFDNTTIKYDANGTITPISIQASAFYRDGIGDRTSYAGRFRIIKAFSGGGISVVEVSDSNESIKTITITKDSPMPISYKCELYKADTTSYTLDNLLDVQTIPILFDLDNLEVGGRNLFIDKNAVSGYIHGTSHDIVAPTSANEYTSEYIPVSEGEHYILQTWIPEIEGTTLQSWLAYHFYSAASPDNPVGSRVSKYGAQGETYLAYSFIAVPPNAKYIRVSYRKFNNGIVKLEKGNTETDWSPAPEDTQADIDQAKDLATAVYGTCSTDAGTAAKAVTCSNFVLFNGARIQVTFTNANTASAPTLNVNSTGAKAIYINKTITSSSNLLLWTAGSKMEFVYDDTGWIVQNVPYALYGTCSTGASTAAKDVTCNEAVICKGTTISVNMAHTNTAVDATMNVGSTLAKDIYANGAKLTTNSRFNWRANTTQKFVFDGQVWRMDDDSVKALATAYITEIDDNGIMVHPEDDDTSGWAISDAIQLFKNGISYIKLWIENNIPKIRIGKEDQGHIILDNDSVDIRNDNKILASFGETSIIGNPSEATHTEISKGGFRMYINDIQVLNLRTTNILEHGYARQYTFFTVVSSRTSFGLPFHLAQLISVYYTDNQEELPTPTISEDGYQAIFPTSPQINRQFVIVYYTDEVGYDITLGTRSSDLGYYPGTYSACIGRANIARYQYSTAIGHGIQALRTEQTILGRWNNPDHDGDTIKYNFLIGNGTSNINRLNAFGITDDNNIHIALDTTASSGTTDAELYDAIKALGWEDDVIK